MMENKIEWQSLDFISEYLGIQQPEFFIDNLLILKDYAEKLQESQQGG